MNRITGRKSIDDVADEILAILDRPDPEQAVNAVAQLIAQARDAGSGGLRQQYLAEARQHIARMDPRRHGREMQELQGHMLALQGRGGDTRIAHVTPREVVIPRAMQTPEFMQMVAQYARRIGIDPNTLVVGNPRGKINPRTGQQEFYSGINYHGDPYGGLNDDIYGDEESPYYSSDPAVLSGTADGGGAWESNGLPTFQLPDVVVTAPRDTNSSWSDWFINSAAAADPGSNVPGTGGGNPIQTRKAPNTTGPWGLPASGDGRFHYTAPTTSDGIKGLSDEDLQYWRKWLDGESALEDLNKKALDAYFGPLTELVPDRFKSVLDNLPDSFKNNFLGLPDLDVVKKQYDDEINSRSLLYPNSQPFSGPGVQRLNGDGS